jgi:hypothetical protein
MSDEWTPKVGERVKRVTLSTIGDRRLVNVFLTDVIKVTPAGFAHVRHGPSDKYKRGSNGRWHEHLPKKVFVAMMYRSYLAPATEWDLTNLPTDSARGREYARDLIQADKQEMYA